MPQCTYCNKATTGFMRYQHESCGSRARDGAEQIAALAATAARGGDRATLAQQIREVVDTDGMDSRARNKAIIEGWHSEQVSRRADGTLAPEDELDLRDFLRSISVSRPGTPRNADDDQKTRAFARTMWNSWFLIAVHAAAEGTRRAHDELEAGLAESGMPDEMRQELLRTAWAAAADEFLADHIIDDLEERHLAAFASRFRIDREMLAETEEFARVGLCRRLRQIVQGREDPPFADMAHTLPFAIQMTERLVWVFPEVEYSVEENTERRRRAARLLGRMGTKSQAYLSTRAVGGLHLGIEIRRDRTDGFLAVTNERLYFDDGKGGFRIGFDEVESIVMEYYGVSLILDGSPDLCQYFRTGDGWFAANVIANARAAGTSG